MLTVVLGMHSPQHGGLGIPFPIATARGCNSMFPRKGMSQVTYVTLVPKEGNEKLRPLDQWFSTTFLEDPNSAHFACLLNQTHLIQVTCLLVETHRLEMGVSDKRDIQNEQCWESSRNVVENHCSRCLAMLLTWASSQVKSPLFI